MILRKPYALLIKNFKLIHIIMFIFFGYFVFAIRKIYLFFLDYVKNSNFTYIEGMSLDYVSPLMFIMVLLLLAMSISIFFLMRKKDKPVLFYKILIVYCFILLVAFIYFFIFFKSLDTTLYPPLRIVINRDIILFLYIVNYFFVAFSFVRGFGFDIKKFSFEKDKKELAIVDEDSEEYEVNINFDKEDVITYLNRQKRELGYYFKLNAPILITVLSIAVVSLSLYFYYDIFVINKTYKENQEINLGVVTYVVNKSYITDVNKYGNVIEKDRNYLIVDITIKHNGEVSGYLDEQALRAFDGENYYYPLKAACESFNDFGTCYANQEIKAKTSNNYILVFKLNKNIDKANLEILKNDGDYNYTRVRLSSKELAKNVSNYKINDSFTINGNTHQVLGYELYNRTSYEYEECKNEICNKFTKSVMPITGEMILNIKISDLSKFSDEFLENYLAITFGQKHIKPNELKIIDRHENDIYISVPTYIKNESNITLIINTRETEYDIALLEG